MYSPKSLGIALLATRPPRQTPNTAERKRQRAFLLTLIMVATTFMLTAFVFKNLALLQPGYTPLDRVASALLFLSEIYLTIQGLGYYLHIIQTIRRPQIAKPPAVAAYDTPTIAIYIATYNEAPALIEQTVLAATLMSYGRKRIYVNCDHQSDAQARQVRAIAERHGVECIHRKPNTGFKAGGINAFLFRLGADLPRADLLCILDADCVPVPNFLDEMVPYFTHDPRVAYVQAPQQYRNALLSCVVDAANHQQKTFTNYISEGKQFHEAMFYCGTNVVFRVEALRDIGGLLIDSITEDFNTSILLHARGWLGRYANMAYVMGVGPETLRAYWTQQGRWALGNMESFRRAIPDIFWRRGLSLAQRWEYFLSGTYYFTGINSVIMITLPALYLLFSITPIRVSLFVYLSTYMPYALLANIFFFLSLGDRGCSQRSLLLAQCLTLVSFPIYVKAFFSAVCGVRVAFAVTPKGDMETVAWKDCRWQLALMALLAASLVAGTIRIWQTGDLVLLVNFVWVGYYLTLLSTLVLFNQPASAGLESPEVLRCLQPPPQLTRLSPCARSASAVDSPLQSARSSNPPSSPHVPRG